jgi:hypothetical protein
MKSDFFEQKLKALLANKEFKQAVIDFRKEWKLPAEGLAVNEKAIKNWLSEALFGKEKPRFFEASIIPSLTGSIREYEALLEKGLFEGDQEKAFSLESVIFPLTKEFNQKIKDILTKFSLPYTYFEYIRRYLIINNLHYLSSDKMRIFYAKQPNNRIGLAFEVFRDTTGEDIISRLDEVKKAQEKFFGHISGRKRSKEDFKRDLMVYELREQGKKAKQITDIIGINRTKRREELEKIGLQENVIQEKLNNEFGKTIGYNDVYKIVKRFKATYFGKK